MEIFLYFIVAFVIVDVLIVAFVFIKRKYGGLTEKDKKKFINYWNAIKEDHNYSHAVINADKLLDRLLEKKGYRGSLGNKLKRSGSLFRDLDGVWSAHKLRNRIAHDMDMQPGVKEVRMALATYERAFRDLGLLK